MAIGIIFDWDGVIVDSHAQHERSWEMLAAELGSTLPDGFFKATFGMRNQQIIPEFTDWVPGGDEAKVAELGARKEALYRDLLGAEGIQPLPGVIALLDEIRAAGVRCAVGSSTPRANLDHAIPLLGLDGRFDAIVSAEDVSRGKPEPDVFLRAAEKLGRAPGECLVFEDAHVGIEAARRAGMRVIALATTHPRESLAPCGAERIVADLSEIRLADLL
ncbi:MAG: HAD family phosphatase [Verrucomicrobiales bacterium]